MSEETKEEEKEVEEVKEEATVASLQKSINELTLGLKTMSETIVELQKANQKDGGTRVDSEEKTLADVLLNLNL